MLESESMAGVSEEQGLWAEADRRTAQQICELDYDKLAALSDKSDNMEGKAVTSYEAHLKNVFLSGLKHEISRAVTPALHITWANSKPLNVMQSIKKNVCRGESQTKKKKEDTTQNHVDIGKVYSS